MDFSAQGVKEVAHEEASLPGGLGDSRGTLMRESQASQTGTP